MDQVRDIRVAQQVRCYREIDGVNYTRLVPALLPELQSDFLLDGLSVHVFIKRPFPGAADLDVIPDPDELRIGTGLCMEAFLLKRKRRPAGRTVC